MKKILLGFGMIVVTAGLHGSNKKWTEELSVHVDPRFYISSYVDNDQYDAYRDEVADEINAALTEGTPEALDTCLEGKNLTQMRDFNESPLFTAIQLGRSYAISKLIRAGTPTDLLNEHNKTFVQVAQELGHQAVVNELERIKYEQNRPVVCESSAMAARKSPVRRSPFSIFGAFYSKK